MTVYLLCTYVLYVQHLNKVPKNYYTSKWNVYFDGKTNVNSFTDKR